MSEARRGPSGMFCVKIGGIRCVVNSDFVVGIVTDTASLVDREPS